MGSLRWTDGLKQPQGLCAPKLDDRTTKWSLLSVYVARQRFSYQCPFLASETITHVLDINGLDTHVCISIYASQHDSIYSLLLLVLVATIRKLTGRLWKAL